MDLGRGRLGVQVLEQQLDLLLLGDLAGTGEAGDGRLHALPLVGGEMIAAVNDDPAGAEAVGGVDIGLQVVVDRLAHEGRGLGDVDGGERVQPELDAFALEAGAGGVGPRRVAGQDLLVLVEAKVDVADLVGACPRDGRFER